MLRNIGNRASKWDIHDICWRAENSLNGSSHIVRWDHLDHVNSLRTAHDRIVFGFWKYQFYRHKSGGLHRSTRTATSVTNEVLLQMLTTWTTRRRQHVHEIRGRLNQREFHGELQRSTGHIAGKQGITA
ncbi:hypothetical protein J6590_072908 [Homalodisca vitripennis]|nr:hypothetical protein J6590_072908 [Homalodisca vitripennis]